VILLVAVVESVDLKTSKFLVFHQEESMAGHMGVNGVYEKEKREHGGSQVESGGRERVVLFSRCF
jgi:hypothetical protein